MFGCQALQRNVTELRDEIPAKHESSDYEPDQNADKCDEGDEKRRSPPPREPCLHLLIVPLIPRVRVDSIFDRVPVVAVLDFAPLAEPDQDGSDDCHADAYGLQPEPDLQRRG